MDPKIALEGIPEGLDAVALGPDNDDLVGKIFFMSSSILLSGTVRGFSFRVRVPKHDGAFGSNEKLNSCPLFDFGDGSGFLEDSSSERREELLIRSIKLSGDSKDCCVSLP